MDAISGSKCALRSSLRRKWDELYVQKCRYHCIRRLPLNATLAEEQTEYAEEKRGTQMRFK